MRILLTNHHLEMYAGSELLTYELAKELIRLKHEVSVFTLFPGRISQNMTQDLGIKVFDSTSSHQLIPSNFDVMHCQHWPTFIFLQRSGFDIPTVFGFLGVLPPLENPPPLMGSEPPLWWGVSEEVLDNVASIPGWGASKPIEPIRNWTVDNGSDKRQEGKQTQPSIAIVSNHFPKNYMESLRELSAEMDFELEFFGLPHNPQPITVDTLVEFDAIITIGRTAITAISLGIPCLVFDQNGMDGWATPENYNSLKQRNFSGRTRKIFPTKSQLRSILENIPKKEATYELRKLALPHHNLTENVNRIISLCGKAQEAKVKTTFPLATAVTLEYLERSLIIGKQRDALVAERDAIKATLSWRVTRPIRSITRMLSRQKYSNF